MLVSEARTLANRQNALKSKGPKTEEGKSRSRANSFKHGLSGTGVVMAPGDQPEVESRAEALMDEFDPKSPTGQLMIRRLAVLSIQMDRGAEHETAAIALKVRHAAESFDDERFERAEKLFETLAQSPRINLRKLRRMPEGIDRLIEEWKDLRDDLTRSPRPLWTDRHLETTLNLCGLRVDSAQGAWLHALSRDLHAGDSKTQELLLGKIDQEIAALEAHRATLDIETIDLDRAEAGSRALFDPTPEAALARRYQSEAQRNFFKALKELRRAEAEFAARVVDEPAPEMASSRETTLATEVALARTLLSEIHKTKQNASKPIIDAEGPVRDVRGQVVSIGKPPSQRR